MSDTQKKLLKNSYWNWILFGINAFIAFWMSPFLVHNLGNERYGFWTIAMSIAGYYGLLDIGFRNALVRFIAKFHAERNITNLSQVISLGFLFFCFAACCTAIVSVLLSHMAPDLFKISSALLHDARFTILIVGLGFALQFPLNALSGILVGLQRYDITAKATLGMITIQNIAYIIALKNGGGIVAIALIHSAGVMLTVSYMSYCGVALLPGLRVRFSIASFAMFRELLSYSSFVFVIGIAGRLFTYTTPLIIGAMLTLDSVAIYSIPTMLLTYASNVVNNFCRVLQPYASSKQAVGAETELIETTLWSSRIGLIIYLPIFIFIYSLGHVFIRIWINNTFAEGVVTVLPLLSVAYIFVIAAMPLENILMGLGQVKLLSLILFAEAIVCIVLMITLIPALGLNGVAMATAIPLIVSRGIVIPWYGSRKIGFGLKKYYEGFGRLTLLMVPLCGGGLLLREMIPLNGYFALVAVVLVISILWLLVIVAGTIDGRHLFEYARYKLKAMLT